MRIVYLHQYFNTPNMAGGTRSFEMGRRLVDYGHQVHMITSCRSGICEAQGSWLQTNENGINVYWLPVPYSNMMSYRERIKAFIKFAWKAAVKAATIDCDVVFATSTPLTIALPAIYASRKKKVPMVFEVRDLWPELPIAIGALKKPLAQKAAKHLEQFAYNNAKRIVALSPGMKEGIIRTGYPEENVKVIPNCCDLDFFDVEPELGKQIRYEHEWLRDNPLVIYTGTIGRINGVEYLARVAQVVQNIDPSIRFVVIGDGIGEEILLNEARKIGVLNNNFYKLPKVPKHDIPKWLSAADIATSLFVDLKEMWANSANKFFDALAAGRPVAINYGGWQAELLNETGAGMVLDPQDYEKSALRLVEKVRDKNWLDQAGQAAHELAKKRFDRDKLASELEKVLLKATEVD